MRAAAVLVSAGLVIMVAALVYGFSIGNGWEEVRTLVAYPWFNVSLIDVYVGFALVCGWIWFREASLIRALAWTALVLVLGNAISCLYVLLALHNSEGNWNRFWIGER
jgi:ABC-type transport system involved in multi-copper enzyme maturation permease subunit